MLVAESGRRAGEFAALDSPARSLLYPLMVCLLWRVQYEMEQGMFVARTARTMF